MVPGPPGPSWRTWGTDAFLLAQRSRCPVLLLLFNAWSPAWMGLPDPRARAAVGDRGLDDRAVLVAIESDLRPDITDRYDPGRLPAAVALSTQGAPLGWGEATGPEALHRLLDRVEAATTRDPSLVDRLAPAAPSEGDRPPGLPHGDRVAPGADGWTGAATAVATSAEAALTAAIQGAADAAGRLETAHGWVPEALIACAAAPDGPAGASWLAPLLSWVFDGPLWDDDAGACRRAVGDSVVDVRMLDDNARWLLALAVAGRSGVLGHLAPCLARLAEWMARQVVDRPARGFRLWDTAPVERPMHVEAVVRGARAWMQAAETLGDEAGLARAIDLFDAVGAAALQQGAGMAHLLAPVPVLRGLLVTQVAAAAAALDAAAASGREAYLDLADELLRNAVATLWREDAGLFVDRVPTSARGGDIGLLAEARAPFEVNLEAATSLARLAELGRDRSALPRARRIVDSLAGTALTAGVGGFVWLAAAREIDRVAALPGAARRP